MAAHISRQQLPKSGWYNLFIHFIIDFSSLLFCFWREILPNIYFFFYRFFKIFTLIFLFRFFWILSPRNKIFLFTFLTLISFFFFVTPSSLLRRIYLFLLVQNNVGGVSRLKKPFSRSPRAVWPTLKLHQNQHKHHTHIKWIV